MELTGLKYAINKGFVEKGNSLNTSESNSKTLKYKQIKNESPEELPKFANGWANDFGGYGNEQFNNQVTTQQINPEINVPYLSGASSFVNTSGITPNAYSVTKYGTNTVGEYFNSPAATKDATKIQAPITSSTKSTSKGSGISVSNIGNIATSGVQFAGDAINAFSVNETGDEIAKQQGTSNMSIGGIGYESPNMINIGNELDRVKKENTGNTLKTVGSGAALGTAILPGWGTAIGAIVGLGIGLFGGEARKREYKRLLAKQNSRINALQNSARFSAQTKAMQLQNAREYGNSESQYLYGAANGKQPEVNPNTGITKDDFLLATPNGYKIGKANSLVEPGETLLDTKTGSMMQVPRQIGSKLHPGDIQPAEIPEYAAVFTDRHEDPITGKSFAQAAIDGDDDPYNLLYRQKVLVNDRKNNKGFMKAKNGILPKFKEGWWSNVIPSIIGMSGGFNQYWQASNGEPRITQSYRPNRMAQDSLTKLNEIDINEYPIKQQLRNAEARTNRAIDMSSGLTTAQRAAQRMAADYNTKSAISNMLINVQDKRNSYIANAASAQLNAGEADRRAEMQGYQWDEDMYARAHAARQQGMQMGTWNMLNQLQQYWANEFKRQQFNDTMDLYKQDQKLRADEIQALLKGNSSLAKKMYDYTKKRMGDYMIGKAATNIMFNPTKATTYKNLTGKWLAGYNFNQKPSIPYIKTR